VTQNRCCCMWGMAAWDSCPFSSSLLHDLPSSCY